MALGRQLLMRMFGRPQGILGRLGGMIMARANRDAGAQVIELLDVRPDDKVLEVGFGPGVAIQLLLQRLRTGSVAGVDQSQEMVSQAAARNADALRNRRVDLRYGSAERLPFADQTFDKALAINSMQAWPDRGAGLREIWRVLKHGGIVALGFTVNSGQPKAWRRGVARRCGLCAGANRGWIEALLRDRDQAVMRTCSEPRSSTKNETLGSSVSAPREHCGARPRQSEGAEPDLRTSAHLADGTSEAAVRQR